MIVIRTRLWTATFRGGKVQDCNPPSMAVLAQDLFDAARWGYSPADGFPDAYQARQLTQRHGGVYEMYDDSPPPKPDAPQVVY